MGGSEGQGGGADCVCADKEARLGCEEEEESLLGSEEEEACEAGARLGEGVWPQLW